MDGDGYGDPLTPTYQCNLPAGFVANNDDCDDTRPTIYPGAPEYCNLLDDDCDGVVDESPVVDGLDWYLDTDGDSYGDPATAVNSCDAPAGYIWDNGDCDDANFAINPAAQEICDGLDNDCDGLIDAADISLDPSTAQIWYQDADGAHFAVKDNGVGIAPQHLERLTERFYRVDTARDRTQGGTGLGLAIVKHVLTRHGGSLHIESELEKGSTFRCDFPPKSIVALEATEEIDQSA